MGQLVDFPANGRVYQGYLSGEGPGVIVLQEWWGLVGHIKDVADRFAAEGFAAFAPDLFQGKSTEEQDEAGSLMMALNIADTEVLLRGAVDFLQTRSTSGPVSVVGFCMGGQLSMYAAATNPDQIAACVNFYGIHPNVHPPFAQLKAPILGLFAEHDDYASPEAVRKLSNELGELGKPHEFVTYPGTKHAFFNDDRPAVYDAGAAQEAWARTLRFVREHVV